MTRQVGAARSLAADGSERHAQRLPAVERRRSIVEAALRVFAAGSYSGATTAEIARAAGVSEPIIYRHFSSKRELYFACLDEAWAQLREAFASRRVDVPVSDAWAAFAETARSFRRTRVLPTNLWMQAITEAGEDSEIRRFVRVHMREVHGFLASVMRDAQAEGGIHPDRDADAEAWIVLGAALLATFADRLGGLLSDEDFAAIRRQRVAWLTGVAEL